MITVGALLMSASIFCFGTVYHLSDKRTIVLVLLLLRSGQGIASGMINTSAFAYAAAAYPENIDMILALFEGVAGIGLMLGPVIGSFVYNAIGFEGVFYSFGVAMIPFAILICCMLPDIHNLD